MKAEGWEFASHTWGHQNVGQVTLEKLQADTERFKKNVDPLIGERMLSFLLLEPTLPMTRSIPGINSNI